ncbi:uncharacterized protein [Gorilla gorilla gorilla]|uniref:uncharacterized protein n=1 Tax=Gorilla gorilla gorilla TaxID=9595 RepID=UPI003009D12E
MTRVPLQDSERLEQLISDCHTLTTELASPTLLTMEMDLGHRHSLLLVVKDSISPSARAAYKEKERWLQTSEGRRQQRVASPFLALLTLEPTFHHLLTIMQVSTAALAVLLCTMALCNQVLSAPLAADTPTACCFSYISRQIPQNFIADYFETSNQCSKPSVIFLTKRSRQVCADPSEEWVQKYVSDLELSA